MGAYQFTKEALLWFFRFFVLTLVVVLIAVVIEPNIKRDIDVSAIEANNVLEKSFFCVKEGRDLEECLGESKYRVEVLIDDKKEIINKDADKFCGFRGFVCTNGTRIIEINGERKPVEVEVIFENE